MHLLTRFVPWPMSPIDHMHSMTHPFMMLEPEHEAPNIVTLLGGGPVDDETLWRALRHAPYLVAADGGANYALSHEIPVKHIVGDFDSLTNLQIWQDKGVNLVRLDEQESTDFEKCLYTIDARIYLCAGFLGRRLDHSLACLRTLVAYPDKSAILLGDGDITFLAPDDFTLDMKAGDSVSLFPFGAVQGVESMGLKWPIEGLEFSPSGQIGTSNEALGGKVRIKTKGRKMLLILPLTYLEAVIESLSSQADAPARPDRGQS